MVFTVLTTEIILHLKSDLTLKIGELILILLDVLINILSEKIKGA